MLRKSTLIIFIVLVLLAAFVAVFAFINQEKLIDRFIQRQAQNAFRMDLLDNREDFKLITVGTGAPLPSDRAQTNNVIIAGGKIFIFDLGEGSLAQMEELRIPFQAATEVFISHWHSDHFIDLPGYINRSWQLGRTEKVTVYGPSGIQRVINGIDSLLMFENSFRMAHHGTEIMNQELSAASAQQIPETQGIHTIYDAEGIKISATLVNHDPVDLSYAFRIDYAGKSVVLSGDCAYDERLISFAEGTDILVHEAMQKDFIRRASILQKEIGNDRNSKILQDLLDYHATPKEAATIAQKANVKKLVLSHLAPIPGKPISRRFFKVGLDDIYNGPIILANDGDVFTIN